MLFVPIDDGAGSFARGRREERFEAGEVAREEAGDGLFKGKGRRGRVHDDAHLK